MNLWGSWHNNSIDWKGFIFYDKFYILDIDGHLKIQDKDIVLKQLSFSIDGDVRVSLKGFVQNKIFSNAMLTSLISRNSTSTTGPLKISTCIFMPKYPARTFL